MKVAIPLPWYSKAVYDITMDEMRSGWRLFVMRADFARVHHGFSITLRAKLTARFKPMLVPSGP